MARAVILHFEDNEAAERFVRETSASGGIPIISNDPNLYSEYVYARVEAVVAVPTKWCRCRTVQPVSRSAARRQARKARIEGTGWTRGKKYGWWLCGTCHKPSKPVCTHWYSGMLNGANDLLKPILGIGEAETPQQRWFRLGGMGTPMIKKGDTYEHL